MKLDELLDKLEGVQQRGGGWVALCPSHEDRTPSLSIHPKDEDDFVLRCHAGCSFEDIAKAVGMGGGKRDRWNADKAEAKYDYVDEQGALLFQVLRMPGKEFPARRREEDGWRWGLEGVRRVPYKLPQLIEAVAEGKWIVIVEGEKDADAGNEHAGDNFFFTCNPGGAGKWLPEYAKFFRKAKVIIWRDRDDPGTLHAQRVRASLGRVVSELHVVEAAMGKDAHDHLVKYQLEMKDVQSVDLPEEDETPLSSVESRSVRWHIKPFVQVGAFHLLAGEGGIGKGTWLAGLSAAFTRGGTESLSEPRNVLIVASEDSAEMDLRPRVIAAGGDVNRVFVLNKHLLLPRDIDYLEEKINQTRKNAPTGLVIIDPISNHLGGGVSGDEEGAVRHAINELNYVAERTDSTIIGVRHVTKSGSAGDARSVLGSVAWVNSPRVVLMLDRAGGDFDTGLRTLTVAKSNRGAKGRYTHYRLRTASGAPVLLPEDPLLPAPETEVIRNDPWFALPD